MKGNFKMHWAWLVIAVFIGYSHASCPNKCSGHGLCDKYSRCTCSEGYQGGDCSERVCPIGYAWSDQAYSTNKAHVRMECSNRGICNRNDGICACMDGFTGHACERMSCSQNCNGNGKCLSMRRRSDTLRNQNSEQFDYGTVWDADLIYGCVCDTHYGGFDCSQRICPDGDDPLTTGQVNEKQLLKCVAISGGFTLFYKGYPSTSISYTASADDVKAALLSIPLITGISVTFSSTGTGQTVCSQTANIVTIEFTDQFGPQPPLVAVPNSAMTDGNGYISVSADGATKLTDNSGISYVSTKGTKEADPCANRGSCSSVDGLCVCYSSNGDVYASSNGYGAAGTRGDCGFIYSGKSVSTCPGEVQCSAHGVCDKSTYRCTCNDGWTGGDCSERICPVGLSWFAYPTTDNVAHNTYTTCSDMGICDKATGKCNCRAGYFGEACEKMACGGGTESPCNGHGRCLSMYELALWSLKNGVSTDYTYGLDPNNALTWDGHRIHGCLCDQGFEGYDCSLRSCPRGDDPGTYNDHSEVQLLQCYGDTGYFKLTFREETTIAIPVNSSREFVENALKMLPSIDGDISVYFSLDYLPMQNSTLHYVVPVKATPDLDPPQFPTYNSSERQPTDAPRQFHNSTVCSTDTNTQVIIVHFTTVHGDLPALTADVSALSEGGNSGTGVVTVYTDGQQATGQSNSGETFTITSVKGTTENAVCNNRGLCDTNLGVCKCFPTWSSSDGKGGPGYKADCGYRNVHLYSSYHEGQ